MSNRRGLNNAQVLAALYNASSVQGVGFLHAKAGEMSAAEAEKLLSGSRNEPGQPRTGTYFDYLNGRIIKTDVAEDPLDFRLFDRDNGVGAGDRAIESAAKQLKEKFYL